MTEQTEEQKQQPDHTHNFKQSLRAQLRYLFGLHEDTDRKGTTELILKNVEFRGANLWTLVFAIFIASIGLNMNSAAVIIGAMLISPLMGPIVGAGFGLGTNDFLLFRKALRSLFIAIIISIITSTLYFFLSPFKEAQSEILSRINPTAFDVFIAIFGGLTGIVAASRKDRGNAVPGVAIATALMPPLCTAGFGLATGQYKFALGAMYLFLINSLFIAVSTLAVVKYLRFPKKSYVDKKKALRTRYIIGFLIVSAVVPSVFTVMNILQEGLFYREINSFLDQEFTFTESAVLMKKVKMQGDTSVLEITVYGKYLPQDSLERLNAALTRYDLPNTKLKFLQQSTDMTSVERTAQNLRAEMIDMNKNLKMGILEELYRKNEANLATQVEKVKFLENELVKQKLKQTQFRDTIPYPQIMQEVQTLFPKLKGFSINKNITISYQDSLEIDSTPKLELYWRPKQWLKSNEKKKLVSYLQMRTGIDSLQVIEIR